MSEAINPPTLKEMTDHLEHFGVKGMKRGVRKKSKQAPEIDGKSAAPGTPNWHSNEIAKLNALAREIRAGNRPSTKGTPDAVRLKRIDEAIKEHKVKMEKAKKLPPGLQKKLGDPKFAKLNLDTRLSAVEVLKSRHGGKSVKHAGVKGMKWGVRKNDSGGGTISVKGRPTYTTAEKRAAFLAARAARKEGKATPKDKAGFDQNRLAKLPTVQRRLVNGILGTKFTTATTASSAVALALAAAGVIAPPVGAGLFAGTVTAGQVAGLHAAYKTYFQNLKNNPKVRAKVKLSASEMASYQIGKSFVKSQRTNRGTITVKSMRGQTTINIFDKEGRLVGKETSKTPVLK